jgi:molecular chaperone GrpE (heat shock protein)
MSEVELKNRSREDDEFKKNTEFTKLNALMEQKLELTEKELSDYKAKYSAKDADFKEVNKELNRTRKEL